MISDFIDKYFALISLLAIAVLFVYHFGPITSGLGTLTKDTGTFVGAFKS